MQNFVHPLAEQLKEANAFAIAVTTLAIHVLQQSQAEKAPQQHSLLNKPNFFKATYERFLIENRHFSQDLQEAYDKRFGLVPTSISSNQP